jgi:hypothetical protein
MELVAQLIPDWPKLAWTAIATPGEGRVVSRHGPAVEVRPDWLVEAAWAGKFAEGDFDRTDLVFGTGIRLRGDDALFVSAGSSIDRLWYCQREGKWHVSNSLPALLAVLGESLRDDYPDYTPDMESSVAGLDAAKRSIPTDRGEVSVLYFDNLRFDGESLERVEKPDSAPRFERFEVYRDFLIDGARRLGANLTDSARQMTGTPLATISRGYDAAAGAVIAREAGCTSSVTIRQATSLWRGSDSGEEIARVLGLSCVSYDRTGRRYPMEEAIWAISGRPGTLNWTLFDYPQPLSLLFTGPYGDKLWARRRDWYYPGPFAGTTASHGGIGELRLFQGIFHCPLPAWGLRHLSELQDISFSDEMEPWTLHTRYDRPIPRRLLEDAGVPRKAFGMRKKNTAHESAFLWPYSPEARASFAEYLTHRGLKAPGTLGLAILRRGVAWDELLRVNLWKRLGLRGLNLRRRMHTAANDLIFQWANDALRRRYVAGLQASESDS